MSVTLHNEQQQCSNDSHLGYYMIQEYNCAQHATAIFRMTDLQIDTEATKRSNTIRQYTYKIILWRIHVTILVIETQQYIPLVWLLAQR